MSRPGFFNGMLSIGPQTSVAGMTEGEALAGVVGGTALGLAAEVAV